VDDQSISTGEIMTRSLLGRLALAAATGLLAAGSLAAPAAASGTGVLQGTFTTAAGAPIGNSLISVWLGDGSDLWTHLWTDSAGHYEADLPSGGYLLAFGVESGDGQWSPRTLDRAEAQLYTVVEGETLTVDEQQL
jgi:hypothetical protein